jgi:uncharacterized protein YkwD
MDIWIIISIVLVLGIAFLLIRKPSQKSDKEFPDTSIPIWTDKENKIYKEINDYRISRNLLPFHKDIYCKNIANKRTLSWKINDYKKGDNFHNFFLGDCRPYIKAGLLMDPKENAQLSSGLAIVKNWINSPSHNAVLLGRSTKAGLCIRTKYDGMSYACLVVAN